MRKFSLFLVVAIVATMFTFVAMPVSAAGEKVEFLYENAAAGSNYDFTLSVKAKASTGLNAISFSLAYPTAKYTIVDSNGVSLEVPLATGSSLKSTNLNNILGKAWIPAYTFGSNPGDLAATSLFGVSSKTTSTHSVLKLQISNGSAMAGTSMAQDSTIIKFYIKKQSGVTLTDADKLGTVAKLVSTSTNAADALSEIGVLKSSFAGTGTTIYNSAEIPTLTSGITAGSDAVPATTVLRRADVLWTDNTTVTAPVVDNKITASITGNGRVKIGNVSVINGGEVNLLTATTAKINVMPVMGYEVESATLGGVNMGISKDGGIFNATGISGTKALVVTFAAKSEPAKPQIYQDTFNEDNILFPGAKQAHKAQTTFASKPATGEVTEFGVVLKDSVGAEITLPSGKGPMFKSLKPASTSGQYGIQFVGLAAGTYTATPYAIVDGSPVYGSPVTFVVE